MRNVVFIQKEGWSDSILSSFVAAAVKERFPDCRTTLVTSSRLRDWGICLHYDRVAYFGDGYIEALRQWFFLRRGNFDVTENIEGAAGNRLDSHLKLLEKLGVTPTKLNFRLKVRTHVHEDIMRRLASVEMRSKHFFVVAPGGGKRFRHKRWTYFAELIRILCERSRLPILLVGGEDDVDLAEKMTAVNPRRVQSWIGKLTREETLAVIGECAGFVGNDSGPAYVAGGTGAPGVVLFGPTGAKLKHPPGKNLTLTCLEGRVPCSPCAKVDGQFDWSCRDNSCMKSISPEQVWGELEKKMNPS